MTSCCVQPPKEIAADRAEMSANVQRLELAWLVIHPWREKHKDKRGHSEVPGCPICHGELHLSFAGTRRHVRASAAKPLTASRLSSDPACPDACVLGGAGVQRVVLDRPELSRLQAVVQAERHAVCHMHQGDGLSLRCAGR